MIFRTYSNQEKRESLANYYANQTFTQKGMLKIYWDNAIKHSKMLHLFFLPDTNSLLRLDKNAKYVDSILYNGQIYEYDEDMLELKDIFNQIDWLYLFGAKIEISNDDKEPQIPYDINYSIIDLLGEKYRSFFMRHLGCIVVPVEVSFDYLQVVQFNISGKDFALEYDFPLHFPIARILQIKEISKEHIADLSHNERDLVCHTIDFLYTTSCGNLDAQILNLYQQAEDEFGEVDDESIKQAYNLMLQTTHHNVFVLLRSSPQIANDNEIAKLFIQDYNIIGYSYEPDSESSRMRALEKLTLQRGFQNEYYKKHKDSLGKVIYINNSLFDYNILVTDILNDEWCKVDILRLNSCKDEECHKFDKTYNQYYIQYPEKLRICSGYMRCENLNRGMDFEL